MYRRIREFMECFQIVPFIVKQNASFAVLMKFLYFYNLQSRIILAHPGNYAALCVIFLRIYASPSLSKQTVH
jgi:hypothetical protein